ncbi:MAG: nucleotide exchange factor GrpE [Syntrophaceae bacterium]|nr:nucleotide exchange factor GrpE [Syntrophaceae bacterium]
MVKRHKKEQNEQANETQNQAEEVSAGAGDHDSGSNDLTAKLAEKEKEAAANYDKYVRAVAELDNYKKRAVKEKNEILKYGKEEILKDILPFLDSLDRALEHAEASNDIQAFKEGLKLIQDQLFSCLKKHGVEAIECAGIAFDPNFHEAMMQMESADHEENEVINEFQRGYLLNGRLLRPSKVCVCKKINKENKVDEQIGENGE